MSAGKLVRDSIPALISAEGRTPVVEKLSGPALLDALYEKLAEEHQELLAANGREAKQEELADMVEVLIALAAQYGLDEAGVMDAVAHKRAARGGFGGGLFYKGDE